MSRKPIIAANWKMNVGPAEATAFIDKFLKNIDGKQLSCDVVIAPPFVTIPTVVAELKGNPVVGVSAQNVSDKDNGAFTGEISTTMLKELGVSYIILGHSERRQYYGETDAIINSKIKKAIADGFTPIFCIGETKDERLGNRLEEVLTTQLTGGLKDIPAEQAANIVIAYEPVWAIGTGLTATDEQANETIGVIRKAVARKYGQDVADAVRIQYGGSMNPKNVKGLMAQPEIDGGLIGGASLKAPDFTQVVLYNK